jgi:TFIIF-interacting CTD phosphatase-like protein
MDYSHLLDILNPDPKEPRESLTDLILILDIDETLVHSVEDMNKWKYLRIMTDPNKIDLRSRTFVMNIETDRGSGKETILWSIKRPHLDEFLIFCLRYFKIIVVWSAGIYDYVHAVEKNIFTHGEPHAVLTRINCHGSLHKLEKPLWKMVKDLPELSEYIKYDEATTSGGPTGSDIFKNVIIIDDRIFSFSQNPNNGILIPPYDPVLTEEGIRKDDLSLLQIMEWLKTPEVMNSKDIRKVDKNGIFSMRVNPVGTGGLGGQPIKVAA